VYIRGQAGDDKVNWDVWPEFSSRTKMDDRNSSISRRQFSMDDAMPFRWYGYIFHEIYFMLMDLERRLDTA
jgi:hypothetical protein